MNSRIATLLLVLISLRLCAAQTPQGKFQCRRFPLDAISSYPTPVAYIWLRADRAYDLLDLTTTKGKSSGHFVYDENKQEIDWTTGNLSKYVGHYIPNMQGVALIRLNTKKDPEGQIDGTMPCVRVASQ